jgi:hypothetical protein
MLAQYLKPLSRMEAHDFHAALGFADFISYMIWYRMPHGLWFTRASPVRELLYAVREASKRRRSQRAA